MDVTVAPFALRCSYKVSKYIRSADVAEIADRNVLEIFGNAEFEDSAGSA